MTETELTPERILEAAEDVLRRFGPDKTTVVDVARALGVSHGSIYRHFASKAALRQAVTAQWLHRVSAPLMQIALEDSPAAPRLRRWIETLIRTKRQLAHEDLELFTSYLRLTTEAEEVVGQHVEDLVGQLARIIAEGVQRGEFEADDPVVAARAVFDATTRFHNPMHWIQWADPTIDSAFEAVWRLILRGLTPLITERRQG